MPLPIDPPLTPGEVSGLTDISGSQLTPWFDSGETKALADLLSKYTTDVVDPRIDSALESVLYHYESVYSPDA